MNLDDAIRERTGELVVKWALVVETIGDEGDPRRWVLATDGLMSWDVEALLAYGVREAQQGGE